MDPRCTGTGRTTVLRTATRAAVSFARSARPPSAGEIFRAGFDAVDLSPDGNSVSTVTDAPGGSRLDVSPARRTIGSRSAQRTVTLAGGITAHAWSPDSTSIFVVGSLRAGEPDRLFLVRGLGHGAAATLTPVALDGSPSLVDADFRRGGGVIVRVEESLLLVDPGELTVHPLTVPAGLYCLFDRDDRPRCGVRWEDDGSLVVLRQEPGSWTEVLRLAPPDSLLTYPGDLTCDGSGLFLHGPLDSPFLRLAVLDLATGQLRPVAQLPDQDVDAVLLHPADQHPMAIRTLGARRRHVPVTARARTDLQRLDTRYRGDPTVVTQSVDGETWLVRLDADRAPSRHLVWDRQSRTGHPVPTPSTALPVERFARTLPFRTTARDGLVLQGYLTLPQRSKTAAPTVVLVHGGPWARDDWEYNPTVQWLARCGYVCLQVNFRGSEGCGVEHLSAADGDWGGQMQDDLLAAVRWAVRHGHTDESRLAVMGTSYGGYAALAAATTGRPVFAAAIAISAASDLVTLTEQVRHQRPYLSALFRTRLGHPARDRDRLIAQSPLTHAARCHTPVLLVHGAQDDLMPVAHAERMAAALRERGKPHRLLVFPDEGHGVTRTVNQLRLARIVRSFLADKLRRGRP